MPKGKQIALSAQKNQTRAYLAGDYLLANASARSFLKELRTNEPWKSADFDVVDCQPETASSLNFTKIFDSVRQALLGRGLFASTSVIWLKNLFVSANAAGGKAFYEDLLKFLQRNITLDAEDRLIVLSGCEAKATHLQNFVKWLRAHSKLELVESIDENRHDWHRIISERIRQRSAVYSLNFDDDALVIFATRVGTDLQIIENELEKLALFCDAQDKAVRVKLDDVRRLTPRTRSGNIFELSEAFALRDSQKAARLLSLMLEDGEAPMKILLVAIAPKLRSLLLAKLLSSLKPQLKSIGSYSHFQKELSSTDDAIRALLPLTKTGKISAYPIFLSLRQANKFSLCELATLRVHLFDIAQRFVSQDCDQELLLRSLVFEICGNRRP